MWRGDGEMQNRGETMTGIDNRAVVVTNISEGDTCETKSLGEPSQPSENGGWGSQSHIVHDITLILTWRIKLSFSDSLFQDYLGYKKHMFKIIL